MVGLGLLMLALSWFGSYHMVRKGKMPNWMLKVLVGTTFSGWVATLAGWYVTEIGRQPWLVTGVLRTEDAVTSLPASNVAFSLAMYLIVYGFLLVAYIHTVFLMARKAVKEEEFETNEPKPDGNLTNVNQPQDNVEGSAKA